MATRAATFVTTPDGVCICTWEGITEDDDGSPVNMARFPDRTVQAVGDFDASGAITMEGSNDGDSWFTLTDNLGEDIVLTAATQGALIAQNPLYIRPRATAGTSVDMDVIVVGAPRE